MDKPHLKKLWTQLCRSNDQDTRTPVEVVAIEPLENRLLFAAGASLAGLPGEYLTGTPDPGAAILNNAPAPDTSVANETRIQDYINGEWATNPGQMRDEIVRLPAGTYHLDGSVQIELDKNDRSGGSNDLWFALDGAGNNNTVLTTLTAKGWQGDEGQWTRISGTDVFYATWNYNFGYGTIGNSIIERTTPNGALGQRVEQIILGDLGAANPQELEQIQLENVEAALTDTTASWKFGNGSYYIDPNDDGLINIDDIGVGEFVVMEIGNGESLIGNGFAQTGSRTTGNTGELFNGPANKQLRGNRVYMRLSSADADAFAAGNLKLSITTDKSSAGPASGSGDPTKVDATDFNKPIVRVASQTVAMTQFRVMGHSTLHNTAAMIVEGDVSDDVLLEKLKVFRNNGNGIEIRDGDGVTLKQVYANENGASGMIVGGSATNVLIDDATTNNNNWRGNYGGFDGFRVAGMKIGGVNVSDITIKNYESLRNFARGLWFDEGVSNIDVRDSKLNDNKAADANQNTGNLENRSGGTGLYIEISGDAANGNEIEIINTEIKNNQGRGIQVSNGGNLIFDNVHVANNGLRQLYFASIYRDQFFTANPPENQIFGDVVLRNSTIETDVADINSLPGKLLFVFAATGPTDTIEQEVWEKADDFLRNKFNQGLRGANNTFKAPTEGDRFSIEVKNQSGSGSGANRFGNSSEFDAVNSDPNVSDDVGLAYTFVPTNGVATPNDDDARWDFNDNLNDSVGSIDGTEIGQGTLSFFWSGIGTGRALSLSGSGSDNVRVSLGKPNLLTKAYDDRTWSLRFKADSTSGTQMLFEEGGASNGVAIRINDGKVEAIARTGGTSVVIASSANSVSASTWYHVAVTLDRTETSSDGRFRLYLNGSEVADRATGFGQMATHNNDAGIGGTVSADAFNDATGTYRGLIDEVRLHQRALFAYEISVLAN